jgi:predicted glutamine amidotransferase
MCVICFKPQNVVLSKEDAQLMWEANSHGAGFCVWDEKSRTWKMKKGFMQFEALWNEIEPYTREGSILVVHFRIVSRGRVCPEQTHPFEIALKEGVAYLFHNGTLDIEITQGSSDTYELAYRLSQLGLNKKQLKLLLKEGGLLEKVRAHSRFAVCLPDEEEPFLVGQWEEIKGLKTSNSYWQHRMTYTGLSGRRGGVSYSHFSTPSLYWKEDWEDWAPSYCECDLEEDRTIVEVGKLRFEIREDGNAYLYMGKEAPHTDGDLFVSEDMLFVKVADGLTSYTFQVRPHYTKDPNLAIDPDGNIYRLDHFRVAAFPAGKKKKNVKLPKEIAVALREEGVLYVLNKHSLVVPYEIKDKVRK